MLYRRIRELREDHDLKQRELARLLCCSQQTYSDYENGKVDIPTAVLVALARYYGTTTDYLLDLTDRPGAPAPEYFSPKSSRSFIDNAPSKDYDKDAPKGANSSARRSGRGR